MKNTTRGLIIGVIALALIAVIVAKSTSGKKPRRVEPVAVNVLPVQETVSVLGPGSLKTSPETTRTVRAKPQLQPTGSVLVLVNGTPLTEDYLQKMIRSLPEDYQNQFKNDPENLLEQLITRELLYQEAEKQGFARNLTGITDPEEKKDKAITKLIQERNSKLTVSEEESRRFYEERKAEMRGASFEQVKEDIKNFLLQEKQGRAIDAYIESLKTGADIQRNENWLKQQRAKRPPDPLEPALKSGKPTVLDLGAGTCVPCKMMKPIFAELEKEYAGRANIILLEISEYRQIANKYNVRIIPTQIFFDREGKVYWRHEGFLPKEEIVKKLKELGVE